MVAIGIGSSMFLRIASSGEDIIGAVSSTFGNSVYIKIENSKNGLAKGTMSGVLFQHFVSKLIQKCYTYL